MIRAPFQIYIFIQIKSMKKIFGLLLVFVCCSTFAAIVPTGLTKITYLSSYNQYGGGDVIFSVANPIAGCENGYWISKADGGFNANLSMLLSSYQTKNSIKIYGLSDQIWGGSAGKYCKMYMIEMF